MSIVTSIRMGKGLERRRLLAGLAGSVPLFVSGCGRAPPWHEQDVTGSLPDLSFTLADSSTGREVTAREFRGKLVSLYFGYTYCPDFCPTTLTNLATVMQNLGPPAADARILFVTVDPERDSLAVLKTYAAAFSPQVVGLRGTADQLSAVARRYRVAYSVTPGAHGGPPEVTHSSLVYVFDAGGAARLLVTSMATAAPDIAGTTADFRRLINARGSSGWRSLLPLGWAS